MALTADKLGEIHRQLTWLYDEIRRAQAEVGVLSAHTRIGAARRRAIVLIDQTLRGLEV